MYINLVYGMLQTSICLSPPSGVHDTGVVIKALQTKAFFLEISSWLVKVNISICSFHEPKTHFSKSVIYF